MEKIVLEERGQIRLPTQLLNALQWHQGMELMLQHTAKGVFIRPVPVFPVSQLEPPDMPLSIYQGKSLSIEEMDVAISVEAGKQK
ncbi:MAG: AbrB/MazE/SpoVT family DNA-binding domain-containing protein [Thioploca sp.]|nr:AbrB/MazE/SpoVT family DNA-binding domain-containing protein [Thioploca sp.]